jgi:hypothetical protein
MLAYVNFDSDFVKILFICFIFLFGWAERYFFQQKALPCATWFFGVLISCIYVSSLNSLGWFRWLIVAFIFLVGGAFIIRFYRGNRVNNNE